MLNVTSKIQITCVRLKSNSEWNQIIEFVHTSRRVGSVIGQFLLLFFFRMGLDKKFYHL